MEAWALLLNASSPLKHLTTYKHDLIMVTSQVLSDISLSLHEQIVATFNSTSTHNITRLKELTGEFLGVVDDMDELLYTNRHYLLGR